MGPGYACNDREPYAQPEAGHATVVQSQLGLLREHV